MIKSIHYKKEHFYFNQDKINVAFNKIKTDYPDINTIVSNSNINIVSKLNTCIRQQIKN